MRAPVLSKVRYGGLSHFLVAMARKRREATEKPIDSELPKRGDGNDDDENFEWLDRHEVDPHVLEPPNKKQRLDHLECMGKLRQEGCQILKEGGFVQLKTEAMGDCWLIAILAGRHCRL